MIRNEREYRITRAQADRFERALAQLAQRPAIAATLHPLLQQAEEDGIRSQLADLRQEIGEYESLRAGSRRTLHLDSLEDLPRALIQARIAAGLTQRDLAERLGLKEQQVQRYEATDYRSATLERIRAVIQALGVKTREEIILPGAQG